VHGVRFEISSAHKRDRTKTLSNSGLWVLHVANGANGLARQEQRHYLTDKLVKCLAVEFLAHRANARLPRLPLLQLAVQLLLQINDIQTRRRRARHILNPQLPILGPFPVKYNVYTHQHIASHRSYFTCACCPRGTTRLNPQTGMNQQT